MKRLLRYARVLASSTLSGVLLACALLTASTATAAKRADVEAWTTRTLADYVIQQLEENPRLQDTTVRFVVFSGSRPASTTDSLSLSLRDQLQRRVERASGLRVAWHPGPDRTRLPQSGNDCQSAEADLFIGLDVSVAENGTASVAVRALDVADKTWVSGFAREWRGTLSHDQRRAAERQVADRTFLGDRDIPYRDDDVDLIATHLAHDLRCRLMRRVSGDYALAVDAAAEDAAAVDPIITLVRNQLGGLSSLKLVAPERDANATLTGSRHAVDDGLQQYWITLMPNGTADDEDLGLAPISTSVYLRAAPSPATPAGDIEPERFRERTPTAPQTDILTDLRLVSPASIDICRTPAAASPTLSDRLMFGQRDRCSALRISSRVDAVVFVLNHQLNRGLVRLDDCKAGPSVHIVSPGQPYLLALPEIEKADEWTPKFRWQARPDASIYYAIAVSDSEAARAVAERIRTLPRRCSASVRIGLDGARLEAWLSGLQQDFESRSAHIDWRALRVRQVY